jgi:hypothetical protein
MASLILSAKFRKPPIGPSPVKADYDFEKCTTSNDLLRPYFVESVRKFS